MLSCFLFYSSAFAGSESKIEFSADYQEYNQRLGLVILKDEARIVGSDFEIAGKNLQYNLATGDIHARGDVELLRDDEVLEAEILHYNVRTKVGSTEGIEAIFQNTFVEAESAEIDRSGLLLRNGCASTCDDVHYHYHIRARKMVLVPGKALYLKGVKFYLGKTKVLSLPAYRFNLAGKKFEAPLKLIPGFDASRGFYSKVGWDFYFNPQFYGELDLVPTSRQGVEMRMDLQINQETKFPARVKLEQQRDRFRSSTTRRANFNQQYKKSEKGFADLTVDYLEDEFSPIQSNKELNTRLHWTRHMPFGWRGELDYEVRHDLDKDNYLADNRVQSLDRLPSLYFESPTRSMESIPWNFRLGTKFTRFRENSFQGRVARDVKEIFLNAFQDTYQYGRSTFSMNSQFRFSHYSGGSQREYFRLNAGWNHDFGEGWNSSTQYYTHHVGGSSPFRTFDLLTPRERLTQRFSYRQGNWSGTLLQMGYNFKNDQYDSLSSYLQYRDNWKQRPYFLGLRASYANKLTPGSLGNLSIDQLFMSLRMEESDHWDFDFRAKYSNLRSRWESFTHSTNYILGGKTRLSFQEHYNAITNEFTRIKLGWIRDLHCLESRMDWDIKQKEFTFQVYLKQGRGDGLGLRLNYEDALSVKPDLPGIDENY